MRNFYLLILLSLVLVNVNAYTQQLPSWTKSSNGIDYQKISLATGGSLGKQLLVAKIAIGKQGVKVLRAQDFGKRSMSAREICISAGALLCINSSFFDEKNNALGLLISSGITFQKTHQAGDTLTGIFASTRKSFSILGREEFNSALFIEALQAGPRLVINNKAVSDFKDQGASRRSGICIDNASTPIFFATTNDSWAISLKEFSQAMISPEVNCRDGLNLDGGGSAQLFMRTSTGKSINAEEVIFDIRGEDEAPVFLAVFEGLKF